MASSTYLAVITAGTIITGCLNSLFTKYQDNQCVRHCNNPDISKRQNFEQPVLQTLQMFIGEASLFFVYWILYKSVFARKLPSADSAPLLTGQRPAAEFTLAQSLKLAIPAVCDLCGTTLVNIGLIYTPVSIYQMTRGTIVLFVAFLSVLFLKRRITKLEWVSLIMVSLGVAIVGLSGTTGAAGEESSDESSTLIVFGMLIIIVAEVVQAIQFVVEEHILSRQTILPLRIVYFEGTYGAIVLLAVFLSMHVIVGQISSPADFKSSPFNIAESFSQMFANKNILISSVCIMISISSFNFFGISITHELSATARSTVDTCRTLLVWILAIAMGWESFVFLQFIGFVFLVFGTLCFNGVLKPETWDFVPEFLKEGDHVPLLNDSFEDPLERT